MTAILLALISALPLAQSTPASADTLVFTSTNLIDVERGEVRRNTTVVVNGNRITAVGADGSVEFPPSATRIDAAGRYLYPGLCDAHVHTVHADSYAQLLVAHGIVFARDLGSETSGVLKLRQRWSRADVVAPELFVTGAIVDGDPPVWPFSEAVTTADEARAAVRRLAEAGVDMIKVYSLLNRESYAGAIEEADRLGIPVTGHVPQALTMDDAVEHGHDCVEHLTGFASVLEQLLAVTPADRSGVAGYINEFALWPRIGEIENTRLVEALQPLAEAPVWQCPTLIVMHGITRCADPDFATHPQLAFVPTLLRDFWDQPRYRSFADATKLVLEPHQRMVKALHDAGVPLICGTDLANPGVFAGFSLHEEMELWQEAGVPARAVLEAATSAPARFLGVEDRLGHLGVDAVASFVLARANPLDDVRNAREIDGVCLRGQWLDRSRLDNLLAEVRRSVAATHPVPEPESSEASKWRGEGEEVAKGRLAYRFGEFAAGHEDYRVTRSADSLTVEVHTQPGGGPTPAFHAVLHFELGDFAFREGSFSCAGSDPVEATYVHTGDTLLMQSAGQAKEVEATRADHVQGQAFSFYLPLLLRHALAAGERAEFTVHEFGEGGDPAPRSARAVLERLPDSEAGLVRHRLTTRTDVAESTAVITSHEDGAVHFVELQLPFGTLTASAVD